MNAQEGYWRKDSHQEEVYSCRLNLCRGEATALEKVYGHAVDSDEFNNTLSLAERTEPVELDTCRTGAIRMRRFASPLPPPCRERPRRNIHAASM